LGWDWSCYSIAPPPPPLLYHHPYFLRKTVHRNNSLALISLSLWTRKQIVSREKCSSWLENENGFPLLTGRPLLQPAPPFPHPPKPPSQTDRQMDVVNLYIRFSSPQKTLHYHIILAPLKLTLFKISISSMCLWIIWNAT
jgi:hypothetical protein